MKKLLIVLSILFLPLSVYAYSDEIYLGGNTLGIEIDCDGILIIGFYEVNGKLNNGDLKVGDYIKEVNGEVVSTLTSLTKILEKHISEGSVEITYKRGNKINKTNLDLVLDNGVYKTGLYVKDSITGIGTLTYIDPETKIYGALGHEVIEGSSKTLVEVKSGMIFKNYITSIEKSTVGSAGSKNAKYYYDTVYGNIVKNTNHGIFGTYEKGLNNLKLVPVAKPEEVKVGEATIYTVLDGEKVEEFKINIESINETSDTKNLTFKITDDNLIKKTGGVVQGMSGSPIMQNGKIIGVVTHVIVDNPYTGYGLFITKMLEEGEKN